MRQRRTIGLAVLAGMAATALIAPSSASATTLEVGGATQNQGVALTLSLNSGTSTIWTNTSGSTQNTCTSLHAQGATESPYTGTTVTGALSELKLSNCTRNVTVHNAGKLYVEHIAGTTNGTVYSEETQLTLGAPLVGYLNCQTGEGTHLGTLTGVASGQATIDVSAVIDCGISAVWTGTYSVTSPNGLGVSA